MIVGWGKDAKKIAYLGIMKCNNCKNYSHFHLYELVNKVKLYFVPVAKFNKKYFYACEICESGNEIDLKKCEELLRISVGIPEQDIVTKIWKAFDLRLYEKAKDNELSQESINDLVSEIRNIFKTELNQNQIDYVMNMYVAYLSDKDTAH
jgi:hypothetical protein